MREVSGSSLFVEVFLQGGNLIGSVPYMRFVEVLLQGENLLGSVPYMRRFDAGRDYVL
ncbi:hypothetical protein Tco_0460723, partial [Tanacetum coccineum]